MITLKKTTHYEITEEMIANMFVGAIEGNSMVREWCDGVYWKNSETTPPKGLWYSLPKTYEASDLRIEVHERSTDDKVKKRVIDHKKIRRGLMIMMKEYNRHFMDMINENDDNVTHDVFLQCITLGEVIYG